MPWVSKPVAHNALGEQVHNACVSMGEQVYVVHDACVSMGEQFHMVHNPCAAMGERVYMVHHACLSMGERVHMVHNACVAMSQLTQHVGGKEDSKLCCSLCNLGVHENWSALTGSPTSKRAGGKHEVPITLTPVVLWSYFHRLSEEWSV